MARKKGRELMILVVYYLILVSTIPKGKIHSKQRRKEDHREGILHMMMPMTTREHFLPRNEAKKVVRVLVQTRAGSLRPFITESSSFTTLIMISTRVRSEDCLNRLGLPITFKFQKITRTESRVWHLWSIATRTMPLKLNSKHQSTCLGKDL